MESQTSIESRRNTDIQGRRRFFPSLGTALRGKLTAIAVTLSAAKGLLGRGSKRSFAALRMTNTCAIIGGAPQVALLSTLAWLIAAPMCLAAPQTQPAAAAPTSRPAAPKADAATDWLLGQAAAAPSTPKENDDGRPPAPTSKPASPFEPAGSNIAADPTVRHGVLLLSNGEKIRGKFATTQGKPLRIYDEHEVFRDVPFELVKSAEAKVLWERDEREWHFKESGSDIKEYSGKTYPAREMQYTLTLANGQTVTGAIVAPLYLQTHDGPYAFVLHKRDKGEPGQTLKQLVYVQKVDFD